MESKHFPREALFLNNKTESAKSNSAAPSQMHANAFFYILYMKLKLIVYMKMNLVWSKHTFTTMEVN